MAIKTYRAKSPSEALALVKQDIGPDAVILHTRTFKSGGVMGLGAKTITEITATNATTAGKSPAPRAGATKQPTGAPPADASPYAERAAMLRDAVELSNSARSRARQHTPARPETRAEPSPVSAPTIVLEPDRSPEERAQPRTRAQGDHSSRLDALYMDDTAIRPAPDATPSTAHSARVVEPKPAARPPADAPPVYAPARDAEGGDAAAAETKPDSVAAELAELKKMMGQVLRSSRAQGGLALPPALDAIREALEESELSGELVDRVIGGIVEELRPEELRDEMVVRQVAQRRLSALIPVDGTLARISRPSAGGPLVIALVGPTGVGKTTTVAKLAATYKLRHGASVGLVTSDTYRIAAVDQLRTYANIIGLPIKVTLTPAEMAQAVRGFDDQDVIILDTAGRSQNDAGRIDELRGFLDAARPDHTQLVLSTTSSPKVIERIAKVFGALEPTHAIATKLDESVSFGPIVDAVRGLNTPLSFVTTGQEVPDQIEAADAERLARRMLASGVPEGEARGGAA
ncbi:MAG: hypothetical protein Tsb0013_18320 [Phycisphaerales bacterium]